MLQAALTGVHVSPADDRIRFHGIDDIDDVEMRRGITPQSPIGDSSPFRGALPRAARAPPKPPLKGEVAPKGPKGLLPASSSETLQSPIGDSSPFRGAFPRAARAPPKPPLKGEGAPKGPEGLFPASRSKTPQSPNGDSSPFRGAFPRTARAPPKASPERGGGPEGAGGVPAYAQKRAPTLSPGAPHPSSQFSSRSVHRVASGRLPSNGFMSSSVTST